MLIDSADCPTPDAANAFIVHSEASLGWGGQEHRVLSELSRFQQLGYRVALVAPKQGVLWSRCSDSGILTFHSSFERRRLFSEIYHLTRWLRMSRPSVVNTHSSRDGWSMGIAARLARVPLVIRSRHIDVGYANPYVSRHAFTTLADHVVTTSDSITRSLQKTLGVKKERISTIATGVDCARFSPEGPKADMPRPRSGPLIGMVSVLRSWKGHTVFFEAIRHLAHLNFQANFVVVGGGSATNLYQDKAREHGVDHLIHFTGHREDVPEILRALDLLVIPSVAHEGIPQIGLQALACGTPAIGSDVGGIPEILIDNRTGRIFPPKDPLSLAETIQTVFDAPDRTREFAVAGIPLVKQHHSLEAMTQRLLALYHRYLPHQFIEASAPTNR
jgi:glycosyltransferase involved in cell wall biosynthesis